MPRALFLTLILLLTSCSAEPIGFQMDTEENNVAQRATAATDPAPQMPNIVFILADDMRADDLKFMPKTRGLLGSEGMTFKNSFVTNPLCCPSRATSLRGEYPHNTRIWANIPPEGGYERLHELGREDSTVAKGLKAAGYDSEFIVKYLKV